MKKPKKSKSTKPKKQAIRFAHPFFTTTPIASRKLIPGTGKRLLDYIQGNIEPIPAPARDPTMTLADIIGSQGSQEIAAAPSIKFHCVGDTGKSVDSPQGGVAAAMATDFDITKPATCPAFFFHLGDVIYGPNKDQQYRPEFYEPYVHYPGKIVAIPGNHDGEVFPSTDPKTLRAFLANFCAPSQSVPPIAGTIFRETMNQPGVYWFLEAPYVQIVGMYSNAAENPGFISGTIPGQAQKGWLVKTLKTIASQRRAGTRKALIFATHHPPFTSGGHSPSSEMLADIDDACKQAQIMPDMFLSGHSHNYQRYTRTANVASPSAQIPFIVAGCGGINDSVVPAANNQTTGDHVFKKSRQGYGYLLVEASNTKLSATMFAVDPTTQQKSLFDSVTVDLTHGTVS